MNPTGSPQLRNSQGNLFLKTDIVSKLLHLMNPIRRESKSQSWSDLLKELLFVEQEELCKRGWTLIFKKDSSFTLEEIRQLMMKFLKPADLEMCISTLRKMIGEGKDKPEAIVEVRRAELLNTVRQLRKESFQNPDHVRFLFELLCERAGVRESKGLELRDIKKIIREEKLPYEDQRLIDVLVNKITERKDEPLKLSHLEAYLAKYDRILKRPGVPDAVPEVIQAVGEKQREERKAAARDKQPEDPEMMRSLFPSAPQGEVRAPARGAPQAVRKPAPQLAI